MKVSSYSGADEGACHYSLVVTKRRIVVMVAALALVLAVIGLPLVFLTESDAELGVKQRLGLAKGCVPRTAESQGWRAEPELPDRRDEPRAVAAGGKAYLAGGTADILGAEPSDIPGVSRIEVESIAALTEFDPATRRYTELRPMPQALNHVGIAEYRGDVYVVGGHGRLVQGLDAKDVFWRYSPATDRWSDMPALPSRRGAAGTGVIGGRLYVVGGMLQGRPVATLEIFDFATGRWTRGPDMPTPREHVTAAVLDGELYVLGGRGRADDALPTAERYDPRRRRWERLPPLPVGAGGLEAVTLGERVVAFGGGSDERGKVTGAVQAFDAERGEWAQLPPMRTPRHGLGVAAIGDRAYAFGGSPCARFNASATVESFSPAS